MEDEVECFIGENSFQEDLEDLFLKHKIRAMVSVYVKQNDDKIQVTKFGKESESNILVTSLTNFYKGKIGD